MVFKEFLKYTTIYIEETNNVGEVNGIHNDRKCHNHGSQLIWEDL